MSVGTLGGDHETTMPSSSGLACRDLTAPNAVEEVRVIVSAGYGDPKHLLYCN